jgi:PAS domain S-box-containing protein
MIKKTSTTHRHNRIDVSGIRMEWKPRLGTCTFEGLPVAMMWVDTTLAGLMSGVQEMVGSARFALALQSEGRKSVESDWEVIRSFPDFPRGFRAIANIAAVAGWGEWKLVSMDVIKQECRFRVTNSWEGRYQRGLGVCWGSGMLAGKLAGYCTKLFGVNCWADQSAFNAKGDPFDEFFVHPSERSIEQEADNLLATDSATRADMTVAMRRLEAEIAERKRTNFQREAAINNLRQSEQNYRGLVDQASDGIFIVQEDGTCLDANTRGCQLLGYTREEIVKMNMFHLLLPEDLPTIPVHMRLIQTGKPIIAEWKLQKKDGSFIYAEVSGKKLEDGRLQGIVRDITQRKQIEQALRESEQRFRALFDNALVGMYRTTPTGRILLVNPAILHMLGYGSLAELAERNLETEGYEPEYPRSLFHEKMQREGNVIGLESKWKRKDGSTVFIRESATAVRDPDGKIIYYDGTVEDITDQKRMESALRQSESNYRTLMEQASDGIFIADADGNYTDVNSQGCRMLGYSREEILQLNLKDLLLAEDIAITPIRMVELRAGDAILSDRRMRRKDGSIIEVEISGKRLIDGRLQGIVRDITARKKIAEELKLSEWRYRMVTEMTTDYIFIVEVDQAGLLRLHWASESMSRITGRTVSDATSPDVWKQIIHPDDLPGFEVFVKNLLDIGESGILECRSFIGTGTERWIQITAQPRNGEHGAVRSIVGAISDITERKRAEEELRTSEKRFRHLFQYSAAGMVLVDAQMKFIRANDAFQEMLGFTEAELLGKTFNDVTFPDDRTIGAELARELIAGKREAFHLEKRYLRKNDTVVWGLVSSTLIRDSHGLPLHFVTQIQDITERKLAEAALRDSESRYRWLAENTSDVIWVLDLAKMRFRYVSPGVYRLRGYTAEEVMAQDAKLALTPESQIDIQSKIPVRTENYFKGVHGFYVDQIAQPCKDGTVVWTETVTQYMEDELSGQVIVLGVSRDITERKRLESQREEARERLRRYADEAATLNQLSRAVGSSLTLDAVIASALSGIQTTVKAEIVFLFLRNGEQLNLVGVAPESSRNRFGDIPEHRVGKCMCGLAVSLGRSLFSRNIFEDQRCTWEECKQAGFRSFAALPLWDADTIMGVIGLASDSERDFEGQAEYLDTIASTAAAGIRNAQLFEETKKAQEEILRLNEGLEQRVVDRTIQLTAANQEMEAFTYTVSHDLRAPLRAMDGFAAMLLEENENSFNAESRRMVGVIQRNARHMADLIDHLLTLTRLGRQRMDIAPINMGLMTQAAFDELVLVEDRGRIDFRVGALPDASGDATLIYQVLINLIDNAIKFSQKRDQARIEVTGTETAEEVIYSVRDNGAGFETQFASKLYGVFERLHHESDFKGMGVGLAIVHRLIERHGGRVWAEGTPDKGATFWFALPKPR